MAWFRRWKQTRAQSRQDAERIRRKKAKLRHQSSKRRNTQSDFEAERDFITRYGDPFDD